MLTGEFREQFEEFHTAGTAAKDADNHTLALEMFKPAIALAQEHDDPAKSLDAMQPAARALWSLGRYDEASEQLETAAGIARNLELTDEQGVIISNMGRIAAVKTIRTIPPAAQKETLRTAAVPKFSEAYDTLKDNPHLYYRYANAQHGSVVAALAGERWLATKLIAEGLRVAFQVSAEPYDQQRTYNISNGTRRGRYQMLAAVALIPFGSHTPFLAKVARSKLVR